MNSSTMNQCQTTNDDEGVNPFTVQLQGSRYSGYAPVNERSTQNGGFSMDILVYWSVSYSSIAISSSLKLTFPPYRTACGWKIFSFPFEMATWKFRCSFA